MQLKVSESDEDIPSRNEITHTVSSDSDLESYDVSSKFGKKPASRRPYRKKKETSHTMIPSLPKRIPQAHQDMV